jgi:hypothetical protein
MNIKKYVYVVFIYLTGTICWLVLFSILQSRCIINVPLAIDSLWLDKLNENLVKSMSGDIAFDASDYGCDSRLIYTAQYYANGMNGESEKMKLADAVDIKSWKEIESDSTTTTYIDSYYRYVLYHNSDGINMRIFRK